MVATKIGRRQEQTPENYTLANFRQWIDRSEEALEAIKHGWVARGR